MLFWLSTFSDMAQNVFVFALAFSEQQTRQGSRHGGEAFEYYGEVYRGVAQCVQFTTRAKTDLIKEQLGNGAAGLLTLYLRLGEQKAKNVESYNWGQDVSFS